MILLPGVALVIGVTLAQADTTQASLPAPQRGEEKVDARNLYREAAEALAEREFSGAIAPLKQLLADHAASSLAELAAASLLECQLLAGDAYSSLNVGAEWLPRIVTSSTTKARSPEIVERVTSHLQLARNRLLSEPEGAERMRPLLRALSDALEESSVEPDVSEVHDFLADSWQAVGRSHLSHGDFDAAESAFRQARDYSTRPGELDVICEFELPMRKTVRLQKQAKLAEAISTLEGIQLDRLDASQQTAVRFELAESLRSAGRWPEASAIFGALYHQPPSDSTVNGAWAATAGLRHAELLVKSRQLGEAIHVLESMLDEYPEFAGQHEIAYLLARCFVARADFERAEQHLHSILADVFESKPPAVAQARARWMLGELQFLQRNYRQAIRHYDQLLDLPIRTEWHARGLMQAAKCDELLGYASSAIGRYERLNREFSDSPLCFEAKQRIASLSTRKLIR